jgi:hypothetical protein
LLEDSGPCFVTSQFFSLSAFFLFLYLHFLTYTCLLTHFLGFKIQDLSDSVVELKITYDDHEEGSEGAALCGINTTYNAKRKCNLTFVATDDMKPPILIHYELTNFHQNHKNYYQSRDPYQLWGRPSKEQTSIEAGLCKPLNKLGDVYLNPCGLIANTFFNDIFTLVSGKSENGTDLVMLDEGIAWQSDLEYKFAQPRGFVYEKCEEQPTNGSTICPKSCCGVHGDTDFSCGPKGEPYYNTKPGIKEPLELNTCYRYHYPDEDTTQYLYETYPDIISPLEGVTNEHFVVWMRVATLPTFRKLYGYINEPIAKGEEIVMEVESNYVVQSFRGTKSLIISTNNIFGGKNPVLGPSFIIMGFFFTFAAIFFTLKHWLRPRKLADKRYLHFKED